MTLEEQIYFMIKQEDLLYDKSQIEAVSHLQKIIQEAPNKAHKKPEKVKFYNFFSKKLSTTVDHASIKRNKNIKGMYIWGEVGRGKTWLMDLFYSKLIENQATQKVQRIHFHAFMLDIHKQLKNLPSQPDPLITVAKNMSTLYEIICLDEFHVIDIADAVILHGLLNGLFENGVIIVTTSNRHPDELYKGGTHRERFLPAIELIKQFCIVYHLDSGSDYRKEKNQHKDVFFIPHKPETNTKLEALFQKYSKSNGFSIDAIKILGRKIPIVRSNKNCAWFTFDALCRGARSSGDYLYIAKSYKVIILSEIPVLHEGEEGPARRFLNLIDAFYDLHVHLILSSSVMIEKIYQGNLLQFEFERALSRLYEMRSQSWWKSFATTTLINKD